MKTLDKIMEQFTGDSILAEMADLFRKHDKEFFDDEVRYLAAVAALKKALPNSDAPRVDELIAAHKIDVLTRIVYAGYNGFRVNLAHFQHPFGIKFTQMDYFDYEKDHIIGHFPENYEASKVIYDFFQSLPEELREYETHISEYFTHFECAGPKLAHYAGYIIANKLLPWCEPGYREDWHQTQIYSDQIKNYCGYLPI